MAPRAVFQVVWENNLVADAAQTSPAGAVDAQSRTSPGAALRAGAQTDQVDLRSLLARAILAQALLKWSMGPCPTTAMRQRSAEAVFRAHIARGHAERQQEGLPLVAAGAVQRPAIAVEGGGVEAGEAGKALHDEGGHHSGPPPQEKPALRGEQLARLLLQLGTKLCTTHLSAVNPVEKTGAPPAAPKKMEGMSTEALTSALATLGFPDVLIKPFRDAIEEM